MTTPTPRTDAVYIEHRYWANEDEATEAIEDLRDLARKLERELAIELERATHYRDEWQKERAKVRTLREALSNVRDAIRPGWLPNETHNAMVRALAAMEDKA